MRSKRFVPGSRPLWFAKASARAELGAFLQGDLARRAAKLTIVRVNALHSLHFQGDLQAVARAPVAMINVPKVESAADVQQAPAALAAAEAQHGVQLGIGLLLNIETPKGLRLAAEIAAAHPCVAGLQLGLANQVFQPKPEAIAQAQTVVLQAAAAAVQGQGAAAVQGK